MHSLARYSDLLDFEIIDFYDTKFSGNMGKTYKELQDIDTEKIVKNFDNIDWENDFDTVILGHVSLISKTLHRDFEKEIIDMCSKYGKNYFLVKI